MEKPQMKITNAKTVAWKIPVELITRLRLDSARRGVTMREIVIDAIDAAVPRKLKVVVGDNAETNRRVKRAA
jgi:hypothetical protein